jgi:hypothetical protein
VRLPPRWSSAWAGPNLTGSTPVENTIGTVDVEADFAETLSRPVVLS